MDREGDYRVRVKQNTRRFQHKVKRQPLLNPEGILPLPSEQPGYYSKPWHPPTYFPETNTC